MHEKALATHLKLFGKHHPNVATSFNNLGILFYKQEKHEEAREMFEKALATHLKLFGEHHPAVVTSFNNLVKLIGDKEAREIFENRRSIKK
jgi:Tfp pilus assembly protein PilF